MSADRDSRSGKGRDTRTLSIMMVLDGGTGTRTFQVRYRALRWLAWGGGVALVGLVALVVSWGYLAFRAYRAGELEREVSRLSGQEAQVAALAQELDAVESAYGRLRDLFGPSAPPGAGDLWLPPSAGRTGARPVRSVSSEDGTPTEWPLTEAGFLTRTSMEGGEDEHPGIDIAVPTGSYVRAAGSGTVVETGTDGVYGNYVVVDHGGGYRSLYGHASLVLAVAGQQVRRDEVIALSGSSGRSTAPHLHFEISRDGEPVDPLTLVKQP